MKNIAIFIKFYQLSPTNWKWLPPLRSRSSTSIPWPKTKCPSLRYCGLRALRLGFHWTMFCRGQWWREGESVDLRGLPTIACCEIKAHSRVPPCANTWYNMHEHGVEIVLQSRFHGWIRCCWLVPEAFEDGQSSDYGWTAPGFLAHSSIDVCVFMWACGPCQSRARSYSLRLGGSRGAPVNVCRVWFCVVFVGSVGGHARCWLGPVHNWDRSRPLSRRQRAARHQGGSLVPFA